MINIDKVKAIVKSLGDYDDDQMQRYESIILTSIQCAERQIKDEKNHSSEPVEMFAAAMANYQIATVNTGDGVTSFKAGDVTVKQSADGIKNAKLLFDEAKSNVADLLYDNSFAFLGV